ncbi:uncharacterized protein LOC128872119 [Hylaeus volcanicus]|uniref:uncharacterized protein LOC128872119 n=1 Tax=Hylaeus volcanicus TaxID=313075 RepID=UPI0023B801D9|nr:uncharacterized protein LOC128872119 [Hylaeus volcanicus]
MERKHGDNVVPTFSDVSTPMFADELRTYGMAANKKEDGAKTPGRCAIQYAALRDENGTDKLATNGCCITGASLRLRDGNRTDKPASGGCRVTGATLPTGQVCRSGDMLLYTY